MRQPLSHPLEGLGPIAEWQVFKKFPMPMEEIRLPNGSVLRLPVKTIWLSPFTLPAGLVRAFAGLPTGREPVPRATDWTRCAIAEAADFTAIAELLEQLAAQAEAIHADTYQSGRRAEHDKKAFRHRFAEYAVTCSGRKLDDLGAALYSMTFCKIDLEEYARLRRRDERGAKDGSAPRRAKYSVR